MAGMNTVFHLVASVALVVLVYVILKLQSHDKLRRKIYNSLSEKSCFYVGSLSSFLKKTSSIYGYELRIAAMSGKQISIDKQSYVKVSLRPWRVLFYSFRVLSLEVRHTVGDQESIAIEIYVSSLLQQANIKELQLAIVKSLSVAATCKITCK